MASALAALRGLSIHPLARHPSPVDRLDRLRAALGPDAPDLWIKRDDLLSFGMGGNKVRKLQTVLADAKRLGATTLITCGGVQSNHCRATAAAGAALGWRVVLVVNGAEQAEPTGNARLDRLFGAEVVHVASRDERDTAMQAAAGRETAAGRVPFVIPLGVSTPLGAAGFARGVEELLGAMPAPDTILHASSSGGTQAGLMAGCALFGLSCRVVGVSADESTERLVSIVRGLLTGVRDLIGASDQAVGLTRDIDVDDGAIGEGYGIPTPASTEALELVARTEGILLDPVYTAKAMAALIARIRGGHFSAQDRVLFWHTGGQPGFFA